MFDSSYSFLTQAPVRNHCITFSCPVPLGRGCELFIGCSLDYTKNQWECYVPCETASNKYLNKGHTSLLSLGEGEAEERVMSCPVTSRKKHLEMTVMGGFYHVLLCKHTQQPGPLEASAKIWCPTQNSSTTFKHSCKALLSLFPDLMILSILSRENSEFNAIYKHGNRQ